MDNLYIGLPTTPDDVPQITEVFYRGFLFAHVNKDLGITPEDINKLSAKRNNPKEIEQYTKHLSNLPTNEQLIVAKIENVVVGVCRIIIRENYNQLQAIYILPQYHRQGIGSKLWEKAQTFFDQNKDVIVHVATYNTNAINFYQKLGFTDTGKRFTEERHRMPISGVLIPEMEMRLKKP